jgi:copper(I)-binding protein
MTTTWGRHGSRRIALLVLSAALAGCQGDRGDVGDVEAEADTAGAALASEPGTGVGFVAEQPWVRAAIRPEEADEEGALPVNTAGYMVLRNPGGEADALVGVDAAISDTVEIHSVSLDGSFMRMRPLDSLAVPAGTGALLEPGGYHLMFVGIHDALSEGDTVALTLRFRSGRTLDVKAPVRRSPPM